MAGVINFTVASRAPLLTLKLSSGLLFSVAIGMLVIMNKIQLLPLAEEQWIGTPSKNPPPTFTTLALWLQQESQPSENPPPSIPFFSKSSENHLFF
ncbi:hypothetical protein K1719_019079 [Acacia pycnantha]|nr:hypothetical protein K1719_019079 [Acacia pycnantha]